MVKKIVLTIAILLVGAPVYGAPSISGTSGTFGDGNAFTINGSSFQTDSDATPIRFDEFNGGTNGQSVSTGGYWSTEGTAPTYNNDNLRDGAGLNVKAVQDGAPHDIIYKENVGFGSGNIYVNFWCQFNRGVGGDSDYQIKLWRLQDTNTSADYPSFSNFNWGSDSSARWYYYQLNRDDSSSRTSGFTITAYTDGAWVNIEAIIKQESSTSANDGEATVLHDSIQQFSVQNINMYNNNVENFDAIRFGEFLGNTATGTATEYFDDIYMNDSWSRVYACEGSTYASRGHCEIQSVSSWSDTSVGVTVNQGSFADNSTVYLYVVDKNNDANSNGHEVDFGTGAPAGDPNISSVSDTTLDDGQTGVVITGTDFTASQTSDKVEICTNSDGTGTCVEQTVTSWGDTSITFTSVQGALTSGQTVYVIVTDETSTKSNGFSVTFNQEGGGGPAPSTPGTTPLAGGFTINGAATLAVPEPGDE